MPAARRTAKRRARPSEHVRPRRSEFRWFGDWLAADEHWITTHGSLDDQLDALLGHISAAHSGDEDPDEIAAHEANRYADHFLRTYPHLPPRPFDPACQCGRCADLMKEPK